MITRETIYAALFSVVSTSAGYITKRRKPEHWDNISPPDMPAIFMAQMGEHVKQQRGLPAVWELDVELYVYVHTNGDANHTPAQLINPLLDAICTALAFDPATGTNTLGGTVHHCWIEGKVTTDEGALGEIGVAIVPIKILVHD